MVIPFSQQPHALLMVRPASFGFNTETWISNAFQIKENIAKADMQMLALKEFDKVIADFHAKNISCLVADDTLIPEKPDAIFPNNWFSTHEDGTIVLYPMLAINRRHERRKDIIELLKKKYEVSKLIDWSAEENQGRILEGTGSIVFDHVNRVAYASRSSRTSEELLIRLCKQLGYYPFVFDAVDEEDVAIYHTNVLMWIGERVACVCLDAIRDEADQEKLLASFEQTKHKVVAISYAQIKTFAGNMLEIKDRSGSLYIAMSTSSFACLLPGQLNEISKHAEPLPVSIPSIEKYGGGGIRCMLAGIHLPQKR